MNNQELLKSIKCLEDLSVSVKNMHIPSMSKEKIIKVIEFEMYMAKRYLIEDLGNEAFQKLLSTVSA